MVCPDSQDGLWRRIQLGGHVKQHDVPGQHGHVAVVQHALRAPLLRLARMGPASLQGGVDDCPPPAVPQGIMDSRKEVSDVAACSEEEAHERAPASDVVAKRVA